MRKIFFSFLIVMAIPTFSQITIPLSKEKAKLLSENEISIPIHLTTNDDQEIIESKYYKSQIKPFEKYYKYDYRLVYHQDRQSVDHCELDRGDLITLSWNKIRFAQSDVITWQVYIHFCNDEPQLFTTLKASSNGGKLPNFKQVVKLLNKEIQKGLL